MIHLNLTNTRSTNNQSFEFYRDEIPVRFLSGIKDINLIVGANNSRKSRFLRNVLSLEQKTLIDVDCELNSCFQQGLDLIEEVKSLDTNGIGGNITSMRVYNPKNDIDIIIQEFCDQSKQTSRYINSENVSNVIVHINATILRIYEEKQLEDLAKKILQLETVCGLILYLYRHLQNHGGKLVSVLSYPEGPFKHMEPVVPGVEAQRIVPYVNEVIVIISRVLSWAKSLKGISYRPHRNNNVFIPVLRTSRSLAGTSDDIYSETIKKQHFKGELPLKVELYTGLNLYEKINAARNGLTPERDSFKEFEHFIGLTFFKSTEVHIVAYPRKSEQEKTILITIPGQKADVPIYDLGDGVQGIINLLFPIFTASEGDWVFIDEPENHLHPGYQNIFIQAISENEFIKKKKLRYFINTHSNHILSESFLSPQETAIFVFSNRDSESSNIFSFDQDQYSTLELLGVMNTSVFVTNCTVWVEGITDRFYIRAFLHAYCQTLAIDEYKPKEGFDFSFVEYAGKNLVHYDFAGNADENIASFFINSNIFLLADSDFDEEKHIKYEKIRRPNFSYHKTEVPEIENLIPEEVLKLFLLRELHCDVESVQALKAIKPATKLGKALSSLTKKGKPVPIQAKFGGTLSAYYKSKLSKYIHDKILSGEITWHNLAQSERLKEIILSLYKFVKDKNKK
jgi:hypothetical protein